MASATRRCRGFIARTPQGSRSRCGRGRGRAQVRCSRTPEHVAGWERGQRGQFARTGSARSGAGGGRDEHRYTRAARWVPVRVPPGNRADEARLRHGNARRWRWSAAHRSWGRRYYCAVGPGCERASHRSVNPGRIARRLGPICAVTTVDPDDGIGSSRPTGACWPVRCPAGVGQRQPDHEQYWRFRVLAKATAVDRGDLSNPPSR